ncbi:NAD-dependent succinate-semialdehyde dehydrogenase [Amycolatopsis acidicola]|nr:NAD-dependent succinate-semialdehyde dehydrogenase [Amycolatopsis acidicola]
MSVSQVDTAVGPAAGERLPCSPFVLGEWVSPGTGASSFVVENPADGSPVASVAAAGQSDVERALCSADEAAAVWAGTGGWDRAQVLRAVAAVLRGWAIDAGRVLSREQGKPLAQAVWEIEASADQFDWYADEARRIYGRVVPAKDAGHRIQVVREPVGVVAAFSSWNFPALLAARKLAPALAAGCPVVICPPPEAPLSTMLLAEACRRAGLPAGVLAVLPGDPAELSEPVLRSPVVRKVTLTGSVPVGRILLGVAAAGIKSTSMELGGHAPVLVFDDVDVRAVAAMCVAGKFRNAGQVCASPSRFFVQRGALEEFTDEFVRQTERLRLGDGLDSASDVGPLINERRVAATEELIADAVGKGATVLTGGGIDPGLGRTFFKPTVLGAATSEMKVMTDEPFAPVAPIIPFDTVDDALREANAVPFGLASYVFTNRMDRATAAAEGLQAGMVGVNTLALATAEAPFGGVKESGFGREGGAEGIEDYLVSKYINTVPAL